MISCNLIHKNVMFPCICTCIPTFYSHDNHNGLCVCTICTCNLNRISRVNSYARKLHVHCTLSCAVEVMMGYCVTRVFIAYSSSDCANGLPVQPDYPVWFQCVKLPIFQSSGLLVPSPLVPSALPSEDQCTGTPHLTNTANLPINWR